MKLIKKILVPECQPDFVRQITKLLVVGTNPRFAGAEIMLYLYEAS